MKTELNQIWRVGDNEIALFRKMKDILSNTYVVDFVAETHLHKVLFHSNTLNHVVKREISDLWIIAFSPKKHRARMTFLQAKYERRNDLKTTRSFYGDYFQHELLSKRPRINNRGRKFNLPDNVLSFSCCASVGSFGVFFRDRNKQIDLAYCSANHLKYHGPIPRSSAPRLALFRMPNAPLIPSKCSCRICIELTHCFDIDRFTAGIINLEIGAELTADWRMLAQIKNVLARYANNNNPAITQFMNFGGGSPNIDTGDNGLKNEDSINLLIINTDERQ